MSTTADNGVENIWLTLNQGNSVSPTLIFSNTKSIKLIFGLNEQERSVITTPKFLIMRAGVLISKSQLVKFLTPTEQKEIKAWPGQTFRINNVWDPKNGKYYAVTVIPQNDDWVG